MAPLPGLAQGLASLGPDQTILEELLILLALTLVNGVFAGAEIAMLNVRKTRLRELVDRGSGAAASVQRLRENPERLFATVQVCITVISSSAAAFGGASVAARLEAVLAPLPVFGPHAQTISLTIVVAGISFLTLVLGELVPKSLALRATEQYALIIGRPLLGLAYLLQPAVKALTGTSNLVLGLFGDKTNFSETRHSPEEISQIVDEAAKSGAVDPKVGEIATRALEFGDLTAWDVMVPKGEVVAIAKSTSAEQLRDSMAKSRHTRIPVFDGDRDNIIGYISTKDILPALLDGGRCEIDKLLRRPFFVPETVPAVDLLQQLQRHRLHMAFVVDEHEAICGIVTFDDLVEELVGEFFGEHQRDAKPTFSSEVDGAVLAEGKTAIRDLNREFDWELPEDEDFSTLGGLVMSLADRIPEVGATFATDSGYTLEVVDGSARRVRTVRVRPPTKLEGDREITE